MNDRQARPNAKREREPGGGDRDAPSGGRRRRFGRALARVGLYGVTLPERLVRSLAAGLGGVLRGVMRSVLPRAARRSTLYRVLLGRLLRFIVEDVGDVRGVYEAGEQQPAFAARKLVGNFLEAAGFLAMQVSPLWVLALVGDAALGTRTYLDVLVGELKAKGVLENTEVVESMSALLERLERLSSTGALVIDLPPTTLAEMRELLTRAGREAQSVAEDVSPFRRQADTLLKSMRELASEEGVSLLDVSTVVGMRVGRALRTAAGKSAPFAAAAVSAGAKVVQAQLLSHYTDAIAEIRQRGFYRALREWYAPYADAAVGHFRPDRRTLTEGLLERITSHPASGPD